MLFKRPTVNLIITKTMFPNLPYKPIVPVPPLEEQFKYISSLETLSKPELIERVRQLYSASNSLITIVNELDKARIDLSLQLISSLWGTVV